MWGIIRGVSLNIANNLLDLQKWKFLLYSAPRFSENALLFGRLPRILQFNLLIRVTCR